MLISRLCKDGKPLGQLAAGMQRGFLKGSAGSGVATASEAAMQPCCPA